MKKLLLASTAVSLLAGAAMAQEDIKLGVSIGFTGPLESIAPAMSSAVDLAVAEANAAGFLGGSSVSVVTGDSTCIDAAAATATAERLISAEGVKGIIGGMCSGETIAQLQNVALPNGVVMISPSATSPALSTVEDNGLFFRTAPSDARQGEVMTEILTDRGFTTVAVTYTNNDYGKGLADSFAAAFTAAGGTVTINAPHDDGKADYSAEVASLASAGGEVLVIAGYIDQGGGGILRNAIDTAAFDIFEFPDGMVSVALEERFAGEITGSFGQNPSAQGDGRDAFIAMAEAAGFDGSEAFAAESYDAAALIILAMAAAGSSDPAVYKEHVMTVANAPGEPILPGEIAKALEIIAGGGDVDYVGASAVELIGPGESAGSYREVEFADGAMNVVNWR
ncbi:Branched-chain amino acid ABC transporter, periplasmic substrate-binding protein [Ketogulonicigenium vulgare]|uniref:Branched-chain amino acid ABC transporter, periplasmic substrate-binding protein n=1 Tax=Ketogulonicigenium vulgare (strain WSH-001) TaxID=759362 RepID=F9Y555_KETVW|nr:ABC transporter substrate-binding protein [Ketogulonicigenium vulgare]AEM40687.1 Branched-chain amino acid ABC transporter, periplasmic substrate-binding protein [Ketogulonicigenium vulgare WSH-001]ALJ80858.1 branched-chain amino acid ABC transporter substrate-binding protein [Ketogulonicigenium vulgare]AOZ54401.1 Branched-chain amino acid ABC transporter, periplasmic substrate-binding protein [Ketogulonicigenium vulgare]